MRFNLSACATGPGIGFGIAGAVQSAFHWLLQASQSNACAAVQLLAAHSACTSIVCCDSLDSWVAYQVALLCLASDPLFGHRYCICSQSPNQIFDQVHTSGRHLQVLRVHIANLRRKIGARFIHTDPGVGYRFTA